MILPDTQKSWIGKAHLIGQDVTTKPYHPPGASPSSAPWILVNSTPATCAQLGIHHAFTDKPPIDLVLSGPNYGRNTTALFALSSGTLGAALEAAVCGHKAIAISFAFFTRTNDDALTAQSCRHAVKVVEYLAANGKWDHGRVFSVNVPVVDGVESKPTVWTRMLQNSWGGGGCFEVMSGGAADARVEEEKIREGEVGDAGRAGKDAKGADGVRHFKWAPAVKSVFDSVLKAGPGSDGWAVKEGETSITALRANFMHIEGYSGEVKL